MLFPQLTFILHKSTTRKERTHTEVVLASFSSQASDSIAYAQAFWYLIFLVQKHLLIPIRIKTFYECCTKQRLSQFCRKALTVGQLNYYCTVYCEKYLLMLLQFNKYRIILQQLLRQNTSCYQGDFSIYFCAYILFQWEIQ